MPTRRELFREFFTRINVFRSRKNWLPCFSWTATLICAIPLTIFLTHFFSLRLFAAGFVYSMVVLGSHGTFWLHRYCTHRAYEFRNPTIRSICRNLVPRVIPEEIYVVSHYVHHQLSEKPGDPYNVHGGGLYCFLADVNHQTIAKDLSERDYEGLRQMMRTTGVRLNSYAQYKKWGSLCHPAWTIAHYTVNWACWYGVFFLIGGHALATALFGSVGVWGIGVRTFNFEGHGAGKDKRREGIDFNRQDLSINQIWPGYVSGEWHNNHHLYPNAARSGFLPYQVDLPWYFVRFLVAIGAITSFKDAKAAFYRDHYEPYLERKRALRAPIPS